MSNNKTIITPVEESNDYENFMDTAVIQTDEYTNTLENFMGYMDTASKVLADDSDKNKKEQSVFVRFENCEDLVEFCERIQQVVPWNKATIYYPQIDSATALFEDDEDSSFKITDTSILLPKVTKKLSVKPRSQEWKKHWKFMPEFEQNDKKDFRKLIVKFRNKEDHQKFLSLISPESSIKTKSLWFPNKEKQNRMLIRWIEDMPRSDPKYPMYIVSKGRHESMFTSRALARMRVAHYIVIEPQDKDLYESALINFNLTDYVTLLVAPFSNHGDGPGRARNWAWDHSMSIGATHHWVLDDNIGGFYRLQRDERYRIESGVAFRAMEDFCDRYDNVYISGPQYRFFAVPGQYRPPFVTNTRIYSVLLIRNSCQHRWRGRYNEDTDLSLRVLKDGNCTIEFNIFLQDKAATQTVKGGNTEEFYHKEGSEDKAEWERGGSYNARGTINKSKMLVDMHPDVARMVWKYDRWHHFVDYTPFKKNKLKLKKGLIVPEGVNEYNNLRLIDDYEESKY